MVTIQLAAYGGKRGREKGASPIRQIATYLAHFSRETAIPLRPS